MKNPVAVGLVGTALSASFGLLCWDTRILGNTCRTHESLFFSCASRAKRALDASTLGKGSSDSWPCGNLPFSISVEYYAVLLGKYEDLAHT
ncbi:hypothetical protein EDB85DRAFT_1968728 [Lactarius pseudohatsudake]|nr:hypothetical protein EDB85DRAFT_1968728 [Lactarius pseudohatsudake]